MLNSEIFVYNTVNKRCNILIGKLWTLFDDVLIKLPCSLHKQTDVDCLFLKKKNKDNTIILLFEEHEYHCNNLYNVVVGVDTKKEATEKHVSMYFRCTQQEIRKNVYYLLF